MRKLRPREGKFLAQGHVAGNWLEFCQGFQKLAWWLNWMPFMVSPEPEFSQSRVPPPLQSVLQWAQLLEVRHQLPVSLIFHNTKESQGGKEISHRQPHPSQKIGTASPLSTAKGRISLSISLSAAGAERQPGRSTSPLPPWTQESASITVHCLSCPQLKPQSAPALPLGTRGTDEALATPRNTH